MSEHTNHPPRSKVSLSVHVDAEVAQRLLDASKRMQMTVMPDGEFREMTQVMQSPSLGRVVLFRPHAKDQANGAEEFVAFIGQVWDYDKSDRPFVNLLTFPPFRAPEWVGSVQEDDGSGKPYTFRFPHRG